MVWWFCATECQILTVATESLAGLSSIYGLSWQGDRSAVSKAPRCLTGSVPITFKQCNHFHTKENHCFKEKMHKEQKRKRAHCVLVKSFRDTQSISLFCVFPEGLRLRWVALSADPASVSKQRLPHHQRLQRGGGGWANISQGLLRSPSTEKYAGGGGMEVKTRGCGGIEKS